MRILKSLLELLGGGAGLALEVPEEPLDEWTVDPDEGPGATAFRRCFGEFKKPLTSLQTEKEFRKFKTYTEDCFYDSDDCVGFARSRRPLDEVELGFFVVDDGGGLDDDFFLRFVEIFDLRNDLFQHIVQQASPSSGQLTPGNKAASLLFLVTSWLSQKIGSLEPTRNNESQIPHVCSEHRAFARRNVLARLVKHCKTR